MLNNYLFLDAYLFKDILLYREVAEDALRNIHKYALVDDFKASEA